MDQSPDLTDVLDILRAMLRANSRDPIWLKKGSSLTIQYEFATGGSVVPYYCWSEGAQWTLKQGSLNDEDCDIIICVEPGVFYRVLNGEIGGREATVSGRLDMRKAPSMPMLLSMRGMFFRYTKALARGDVTAPEGEPET